MSGAAVARADQAGGARQRLPVGLSAMVWALPISVIVLLLAVASASGALGSDLLVFNLVWVLGSSGGVGALLATRRPRNAVGWLLWFSGASLGLTLAASYYVGLSVSDYSGTLPGTYLAACYAAWLGSMGLGPALVLVPLLFPDGRPLPGIWRWITRVLVVALVLSVVADVTRAGPLFEGYAAVNPLGLEGGLVPEALGMVQTVAPLGALLAVVSVVVRYRRGGIVERQQLRWLALSAIVGPLGLAIMLLGPEQLAELGFGILVFSLGLVPLAIGVAIFRYRLYEIDRIVSRTVAWLVLTLVLAAVFGGLIVGLQAVLAPLTEGNTLAVAASTLVAFALFQPLRRRIQAGVDRRFNRTQVNAQLAVDGFAGLLRDEVNLGSIEAATVRTVATAVQPAQVVVWVRGAGHSARAPVRPSVTVSA